MPAFARHVHAFSHLFFVTAYTKHTQIPFCGLPIECRTLSFRSSSSAPFSSSIFPSFPLFSLVSPPPPSPPHRFFLVVLYRRLHATSLHVLYPLFRIIATKQNGTMRTRMIPTVDSNWRRIDFYAANVATALRAFRFTVGSLGIQSFFEMFV